MQRFITRFRPAPLAFCLALFAAVFGCDAGDRGGDAAASAAGAGGTAGGRGVIGVALLTLGNPFFKEMGDAITAAAAEAGYGVRIVSAEMDPARQGDQVRDLLAADVVALVLTPADSKAVGAAIRDANGKKVPVFTADIASLDPGAKVVSHVATDNRGGGVQAGEEAARLLGGAGKVAVLDHPEVESVILRTAGFEEAVGKHTGIQIVAKLPGGGQRDQSFRATQDVLQAHPDVALIFAINDPSALGAVAALEASGKLGAVRVLGFDGQPEAKRAVLEGKIAADAVQYPDRIGRLVVGQVVKYLAGEEVEAEVLIPTALYRKADAEAELGAGK